MENIVYELFNTNKYHTEPGHFFITYKKHIYDINISHYMHIQTVYEHLNRIQYKRLELDTTDQTCSIFQFYAGYHTRGKDKP